MSAGFWTEEGVFDYFAGRLKVEQEGVRQLLKAATLRDWPNAVEVPLSEALHTWRREALALCLQYPVVYLYKLPPGPTGHVSVGARYGVMPSEYLSSLN